MVNPINPNAIQPAGISAPGAASGAGGPDGKFMDLLLKNLDEVNRLQTEADQSVQDLYTGKTDDVAGVFTAVNKAGVAFDLLMEIRNKLVDAYQEIQQIRV
ncbi:MAG TPA: flagellar hook-basal body complex protein FliE [Phycisphaerae bacterium]|nr:flagellar hook-basal body complex protein FliE [Phycisphaerae bacterium]